ncbi:hypothetical protein DVH24_016474 [Malus domestica]|uniref:Protein kinase domain-containing protein n=1 Tax=Malus domestica TaxID=3750 RepID=A0A498HUJ2_MALDO|nr:hypothetical protein DVH24_016474 [Malus domestica]
MKGDRDFLAGGNEAPIQQQLVRAYSRYNRIPYPNRITNSHRATNTAAVAGAALLFAAPAIALAYWRRRKSQDHLFDEPAEEDQEVHLRQLKRFSLRELQVAYTFSNKNIIGRGGFGKVYKGCLALAFGRGGSKVLLVELALALARLQFNSPVPNDMHIGSVPCMHQIKRFFETEGCSGYSNSFGTASMDYTERDELEEARRHPELQYFGLSTIIVATDNFSPINKLGQWDPTVITSSTSVSVWLILLFRFFHLHKLAANVEGMSLCVIEIGSVWLWELE